MTNETLNYYNQKANDFVMDTIAVEFTEIQDFFLEQICTSGKILDLGCGSGRDTKYFLDRGYRVIAVDGSVELCKIASEFTGIEVRQMLFEELEDRDVYDGVWACASILHVTKDKLPNVIGRIGTALKSGGVAYMSFKYGDFEGVRNGRYFTCLTETSFEQILEEVPDLRISKMWVSKDVRADRGDEQWLNILVTKMV